MKKFWIVLLALGLVAGFALSASAADVKFSGSYYIAGVYDDNPSLRNDAQKNDPANATKFATGGVGGNTPGAQAFYAQRFRLQTEFQIAEGLKLVTRFDALEKKWGSSTTGSYGGSGQSWYYTPGLGSVDNTNRDVNRGATTGARIQEDIEWERSYVDFTTKIGQFQIGYQNAQAWGTDFMDSNSTRASIKYFLPVGPVTIVAFMTKVADNNAGTMPEASGAYKLMGSTTSADSQIYDLGAIYKFSKGEAGIVLEMIDSQAERPSSASYASQPGMIGANYGTGNFTTRVYVIDPYFKVKLGPLYVEGEAYYGFGDAAKFDNSTPTISLSAWGAYLKAQGDFGPAYVGGLFAYMSGADPTKSDTLTGNLATITGSNTSFTPCLLMFNYDMMQWAGFTYGNVTGVNPVGVAGTNAIGSGMDNALFYQLYAGVKPTPKSNIRLSVSYANADQKPTNFVSNVYGTEIDLTATYKIFDNLEYMIGAGYMITGDYFKGTSSSNGIADNYMLMHKLTVNF